MATQPPPGFANDHPTTIDYSAFPHIVKQIFYHSSVDVQIAFWGTCKAFNSLANQVILGNIRLDFPSSMAPGATASVFSLPSGRRLPGLRIAGGWLVIDSLQLTRIVTLRHYSCHALPEFPRLETLRTFYSPAVHPSHPTNPRLLLRTKTATRWIHAFPSCETWARISREIRLVVPTGVQHVVLNGFICGECIPLFPRLSHQDPNHHSLKTVTIILHKATGGHCDSKRYPISLKHFLQAAVRDLHRVQYTFVGTGLLPQWPLTENKRKISCGSPRDHLIHRALHQTVRILANPNGEYEENDLLELFRFLSHSEYLSEVGQDRYNFEACEDLKWPSN
jgi:hypothetical protein